MRPRVLKRRLLAAAITGFVGVILLTNANAKADSGDLVTWAGNNGYTGTAQAVILRGSLVCADLAGGDNSEQAAQDLWLHTGIETIGDARQFVIAAVDNLCPQYDRRGNTPAPTGRELA
jgi:Protein of unknown function (DUF732)